MSVSAQRGMTFIELIISMVIIGIALAGILSVMNLTTARSADPMIQHQALAIAEAYMEEILTKEYNASNCPAGSGASRSTYCSIDHYASIDEGPTDQLGNPIVALASYQVRVGVGAPDAISGVPMKRINVSVGHPSGVNITLSGYRADY